MLKKFMLLSFLFPFVLVSGAQWYQMQKASANSGTRKDGGASKIRSGNKASDKRVGASTSIPLPDLPTIAEKKELPDDKLMTVVRQSDEPRLPLGVLFFSGQVSVNNEKVVTGVTVFSGNRIETGANSFAQLNLGARGMVLLQANSIVTLTPVGERIPIESQSAKGSVITLPSVSDDSRQASTVRATLGNENLLPSPSSQGIKGSFLGMLGQATQTTVYSVTGQGMGNTDPHDNRDEHQVSPKKPKPPRGNDPH